MKLKKLQCRTKGKKKKIKIERKTEKKNLSLPGFEPGTSCMWAMLCCKVSIHLGEVFIQKDYDEF